MLKTLSLKRELTFNVKAVDMFKQAFIIRKQTNDDIIGAKSILPISYFNEMI
jgi:hypothetical protein